MAGDARKRTTAAAAPAAASPGWEERSMRRVVASGRDQLLERSRRIVEAADELLDEGLEELTIRAVLNKSGLSRRAFYERFSGKDELVLAVFEHTVQRAATHYGEQAGRLADPMARLRLIVTGIVLGRAALGRGGRGQGDRRGAALSREHLRLADSHPDELQEALRPLLDLIAGQLAAGMEAGVVRRAEPARLASLVYNLVSTTVHSELLASRARRADRAQLAEDIWEFCRRALAN